MQTRTHACPWSSRLPLLKGGVGKTTTAVALAEAATVAGPVTLVDTDPMGAAVRWSVLAEESGRPLEAAVIGHPSASLGKCLGMLARDSAVVVIDAPPPGALAIAQAANQAASIVIVPIPARMADLDRVPATLDIARQGGQRPARRRPARRRGHGGGGLDGQVVDVEQRGGQPPANLGSVLGGLRLRHPKPHVNATFDLAEPPVRWTHIANERGSLQTEDVPADHPILVNGPVGLGAARHVEAPRESDPTLPDDEIDLDFLR